MIYNKKLKKKKEKYKRSGIKLISAVIKLIDRENIFHSVQKVSFEYLKRNTLLHEFITCYRRLFRLDYKNKKELNYKNVKHNALYRTLCYMFLMITFEYIKIIFYQQIPVLRLIYKNFIHTSSSFKSMLAFHKVVQSNFGMILAINSDTNNTMRAQAFRRGMLEAYASGNIKSLLSVKIQKTTSKTAINFCPNHVIASIVGVNSRYERLVHQEKR
ncbi:LOW QUALITY PROTEIN: hypothetical protein V1478_005119 [Vespula squamosa]|uniref:Ribosomal protein S3 n=1 Tax=Vespula squamosa TaxID=30214 RepID=A0ABD2BDA1_VESSQ